MKMTKDEYLRYDRHLRVPEIGVRGQRALKKAKILVIGAGGLGASSVPYLAAAGVGKIGIVDGDLVHLSNLQRQILFSVEDIGALKVKAIEKHLNKLNDTITIETFPFMLTQQNAPSLFKHYDLILDGTDNFKTKYLINDQAFHAQKPYIFASIHRFEGQLSVFNFPMGKGKFSPNYRDIFPHPPQEREIPSCSEAGVLGILPGIIGCYQANEALKIICKIGHLLIGKLWIFDALTLKSTIYKYTKSPENPLTNHTTTKIASEVTFTCNVADQREIPEIETEKMKNWEKEDKAFTIVDVRDPEEFNTFNIGGLNIPLGEIEHKYKKIPTEHPLILLCHSGRRSRKGCKLLVKKGIKNSYSLKGGLSTYLNYK